jgi:hypothetical protein
MFSALYVAVLLMMSTPNSFEIANKTLFEHWGTTLDIPARTFGTPTTADLEKSSVLLKEMYEQLVFATTQDLSTAQRELRVPFALGMIEGVQAAGGDENAAKACLKHLAGLDDAVKGWTASRIWRMRLHAYDCLGKREKQQECVQHILEMKYADIEDQLVAVLCNENPVNFAAWDKTLASSERNDLRWHFACGVVQKNPKENLKFLFSLADNFVKLGVDRRMIDAKISATLLRMNPPIDIAQDSKQEYLSSLALRMSANLGIEQKNHVFAKQQLLKLLDRGCAFSAQQLLTNADIDASDSEKSTSIEIVLQSPEKTSYTLSYWQLVAGSHAARAGHNNKAIEVLALIPSESDYFDDAQHLLHIIHGSDVAALQKRIDQAAISGEDLKIAVKETISSSAANQLLQHYIRFWHSDGTRKNPWLPEVVGSLLEKTNATSPSLLGEANRLLGRVKEARRLFEQSNREQGELLQVVIGLADCNRDFDAMRQATKSFALGGENEYWFWFANSRALQWFCEDGGDKMKAQAKVNRLKRLDPNLGGERFASVFRDALR